MYYYLANRLPTMIERTIVFMISTERFGDKMDFVWKPSNLNGVEVRRIDERLFKFLHKIQTEQLAKEGRALMVEEEQDSDDNPGRVAFSFAYIGHTE